MRFDYGTLNTTERWLTKSKYRYFFPYGIEICDTLKMARDVIAKMPTYQRFCEENGYLTKNGQYRLTAEIIYRFITKDNDFVENHTALDDSCIEARILFEAISKGSILGEEYKTLRSISRLSEKTFMVKKNGETVFATECVSITYRKSNNTILLK